MIRAIRYFERNTLNVKVFCMKKRCSEWIILLEDKVWNELIERFQVISENF